MDMMFEIGTELAKWGLALGLPVLLLCKGDKAEKIFRACGLKTSNDKIPLVYAKHKREYGTEYTLHVPDGLSPKDLEDKKEKLEHSFGSRVEILPSTNRKVMLKVYKNKIKTEEYKPIFLKGLSLLIGNTYDGLLTVKLDREYVHMVIGGTTGSGKSVLLRTMILNLLLNNDNIDIHLCDLKKVEFKVFAKCKQVVSYADTLEDTLEALKGLRGIVYRRLDMFKDADVENIDEYNKKHRKLNRHILFIDELANLTLNSKEAVAILIELLMIARCVGIHIVMATQRPDKDILDGKIKANVQITAAMRVRNDVNSKILLDHAGAEHLRDYHGILQTDGEIEFKGFNISVAEARELIKHLYMEKKKKEKVNTSGVMQIGFTK